MSIFRKLNNFSIKSRLGLIALTVFVSMFGISFISHANTIRWYISGSDPYIQDWSATAGIAADDNWDNFISITGHRGDDLTTGTGVDPQTILTDGESTPLDVIANQSNPNTLTTGGVAEFDGIANPTIALKGSVTADAPHLIIRLNRESCPETKFITVTYRVRDLDSTANNAVQAVALHYRVGTTGNYTNLPGAFVPDATNPNTATTVTDVVGNLPHIPAGINEIYLRIMTSNAAGTDEWVGIDDINVGCFAPTAAAVPVSGKVLTTKGTGIARALITMTDDRGNTFTTRTNTFGFYKFENVAAGQSYVFSITSKNYNFEQQIVPVLETVSELNFYALE